MVEKELPVLIGQGAISQTVAPEEIKVWKASGGHWFFACILLAVAAAIISIHTLAGIAALGGALWYMVFLSKPQSYTVGSGLSELSSVDTEVEEASAFICAPFPSHGFGSNLSDDDVKAATTAGYIGVYGPPN